MSYLSDPRVLFAAERTLMAWSRTAAGLMAFGLNLAVYASALAALLGVALAAYLAFVTFA